MRATDDIGVGLNAEYRVEPDGDHLALVLESAGGKGPSAEHPRNHQYAPALRLLLERLRELEAVIVSAVVDSAKVQHLPEAERSLISTPVVLAQRTDLEALRGELTRAQGPIGQQPGAPKKGNNSKKIRLRLDVPGFRAADARRLEVRLAGGSPLAKVDRAARASLLPSFLDLDEPVALLWAIGQFVAGHERLFRQSEFHTGVGPLLTAFGPGNSTPEDASRRLRERADLWEETGARAGFTRRAADRLRNRRFRAQVIDVVRRDHVTTLVDFEELLAEVGLSDYDAAQPTALEVLRPLIGTELRTVTEFPNTILELRGEAVVVATAQSPEGQPVPVSDVQNGLDLVREHGVVGINTDELGPGSAFVGAVLRTLPGAVVGRRPATITLAGPAEPPRSGDRSFAVLDGTRMVTYRKEQDSLRRFLVGDRLSAKCDLCGHEVPMGMLVAAHIKLRSRCTDEERSDLRNVAMLACKLGCDHLYEDGYVAVDDSGLVLTSVEVEQAGIVGDHLRRLRGRRCTAHRPESAGYFSWHRANKFRG